MAENETNWSVRATTWELLALSLRYPDATLAQVAASGEWKEAAEEVAAAMGVSLPESFATDARMDAESSETALHTLRVEATRLFIGSSEPAVSPFEGVWRAADDGVQALLFVNPHSMAVERFCKACGLGRPEGTNEPLDHAATECELMQWLAMIAGGMVQEPEAADFPGGSSEAAYIQFGAEHVRVWLDRFAGKLAAETRLPFYRAVAGLLKAMLPALIRAAVNQD